MAAMKSIMTFVAVAFLLFSLYWLISAVYLLTWHPLAKYPGPRLAAISDVWWAWAYTSGRYPFIIQDAHRRYGDVVRIAPNHLVFGSVQAYHDIHGLPSRGRARITKDEFYNKGQPIEDIIGARDPAIHAQLRRQLAPGFSPRALRAQETTVRRYADFFVQRLGELGRQGLDPINMTEAWNWVTFDIIGELAFGESLGAVAAGQPKHPWISFILDAGYWLMLQGFRRRMPFMKLVLPFLLPWDASSKARGHQRLTLEKARRRLAREANPAEKQEMQQNQHIGYPGREEGIGPDPTTSATGDFFSHILHQHRQSGTSFSDMEMATHGRVLISAGSETMATSLTAITQYLVSHPECLRILTDEIRTRFPRHPQSFQSHPGAAPWTTTTHGNNDQDIDGDGDGITNETTLPLPYLNAVIEEGLRLLPVASFGQPRTLPSPHKNNTPNSPTAVEIDNNLIPANVTMSTSSYALARDPRYWHEPEEFRPERWLSSSTTTTSSTSTGPPPPPPPPPHYYSSSNIININNNNNNNQNPYASDDRRASNPFGVGNRSCLGTRLAYLELRVLLAKVIHAYDLEGEGVAVEEDDEGKGKGGRRRHMKPEEWNRECRLYLLWRKPEVLVRFRPRDCFL